jgi:hypothetical protein
MAVAVLLVRQLAALGTLSASSWLVGRAVVRVPLRGPIERFAFFVGAGLGTLSVTFFLLGLVGWLTPFAVLGVAGAALATALVPARAVAGNRGRGTWRDAPASWRCALTAAGLLVTPAFLLSLYPPTAFDETTYHLSYASAFAATHRLVVVPEHLFPVYPQLLEMLFSALMLVFDDVATHVVQFLCMLVTTAAIFGLGKRFADPRAALLGAALWLANPLVHYQAASSYVDLGYAMFAVLAIMAFELWREGDQYPWLAASGLLVGFAADTKYLGLVWLAILGVATLWSAPPARRFGRTALFIGMALAAMAPWYVRNTIVTGNPVFPFFAGLISNGPRSRIGYWAGGGGWFFEKVRAAAGHPWTLVTLPWRAAFDRASSNLQPPISPWYLLVLPVMAWQARRDLRLRRWLLFVIVYAAAGTAHDPRFQLPSGALLSAGGGICLSRILDHLRPDSAGTRRFVAVLALFLAVLGPAYATYKVVRQGMPPATAAARDEYLSREVPGYDVLRALNRSCGTAYTLFVVGGERLAYYAKGRFLGQRGGPFASAMVESTLNETEHLHDRLSGWGVDYLYVSRPRLPGHPDVRSDDPRFRLLFRLMLRGSAGDLYALADDGRLRSPCQRFEPDRRIP